MGFPILLCDLDESDSCFFSLTAGRKVADRIWVVHIVVIMEAVAILSWLAGWTSSAIQLSSNNVCGRSENQTPCRVVKAAVTFAAL